MTKSICQAIPDIFTFRRWWSVSSASNGSSSVESDWNRSLCHSLQPQWICHDWGHDVGRLCAWPGLQVRPNDTFTILEASINSCIFTIFPSPPSSSTLEFLVWVCLGLNETQCVESGRDAFLAPHLGWQVPLKRNVKKILGTPQMGHHPQFHWYSGHSIQFMILLVMGAEAPLVVWPLKYFIPNIEDIAWLSLTLYCRQAE